MTDAALHFADLPTGRTAYLDFGTGTPVLFIHGAGLIGGWDFARDWGAEHRMICPYQAGWGPSDDPAPGARVDDYVAQMIALLDHLGLERCDVVGFSMGGWIASTLAARHPDRVGKLVLVAPAGYWSKDTPAADLFAIPGAEILSYLAADPATLLPYFGEAPDPVAVATEIYRNDSAFAQLAWEKLGHERHLDLVARITAPTLLIWGEKDAIIPFSQAPLWQSALGGAALCALPETGHYPFLETETAAQALLAFLKSDPQP